MISLWNNHKLWKHHSLEGSSDWETLTCLRMTLYEASHLHSSHEYKLNHTDFCDWWSHEVTGRKKPAQRAPQHFEALSGTFCFPFLHFSLFYLSPSFKHGFSRNSQLNLSDFIRTNLYIHLALHTSIFPYTENSWDFFFTITDIWITPRVKYTDLFLWKLVRKWNF